MSAKFRPATRQKARLRMAIDGPAGSGKSLTGLRFAFAFGGRVAAIDTENGSLSKYHGDTWDGNVFEFEVSELTTFSPTEYAEAIEEAGRQKFDVLLIDSLSHAWAGKDGALEIKDRQGGNSFAAWKDVTPMHNRMVDAILGSPCHVIVTMRSKTEFVLELDEKGKQVPRKIGMQPVQRPGMEYEFDVYGSMDWSHVLKISKSRCSAVQDAVVSKPGAGFMRPVIDWLNVGAAAPPVELPKRVGDEQLARITSLARQLKLIDPKKIAAGLAQYKKSTFADLLAAEADEVEGRLRAKLPAPDPESAAPAVKGSPALSPAPTSEPAAAASAAAFPVSDSSDEKGS